MKNKKRQHHEKPKNKKKTKPTKEFITRDLIQFIGLDQLSEADQKRIKEVLYQHFNEIEREIKQITAVKLHFKAYEKEGRKKYSVKLLIDSPTRPIVVDNMYSTLEWKPVAMVHKIIEKAKREIEHRLKTTEIKKGRKYRRVNL